MNNYGIICDSQTLRNVTSSWWANADFSRIENIVYTVEHELAGIIGHETMEWLATGRGRGTDAWTHAACAIGYMACMRYYRLNDISHQDGGRKVKIDHDNEARPFEWQLARDDRAHMEEYYRALDRLLFELHDVDEFHSSSLWKQQQLLIVKDENNLSWLTGTDPSPWLYLRLVPFLAESQHFVEKAYGTSFVAEDFLEFPNTDTLQYAAQKAVCLGALALMGRRTSLQTLPYGLMKLFESDGGGNRQEAVSVDQLNDFLKHLSHQQHYWINEMKQLRDLAATGESSQGSPPTYLQMPENDPHNKFMSL